KLVLVVSVAVVLLLHGMVVNGGVTRVSAQDATPEDPIEVVSSEDGTGDDETASDEQSNAPPEGEQGESESQPPVDEPDAGEDLDASTSEQESESVPPTGGSEEGTPDLIPALSFQIADSAD